MRLLRDYRPGDFEAIKALHEASGIDYRMPNLNSPLFLITKVAEVDGIVRAAGGLYIQVETYLWLDQTNWASPEDKLDMVRELSNAGFHEAYLRGIDCAVLWLPPGMERFGRRLEQDLGFKRDREGWATYSRKLE